MQTPGMPLSRFKVLDLTKVRAGPTCVRQLADWGADVIKIEEPPSGKEGPGGDRDGFEFQNLHRNKRSIMAKAIAGEPLGRGDHIRFQMANLVARENGQQAVDRLFSVRGAHGLYETDNFHRS